MARSVNSGRPRCSIAAMLRASAGTTSSADQEPRASGTASTATPSTWYPVSTSSVVSVTNTGATPQRVPDARTTAPVRPAPGAADQPRAGVEGDPSAAWGALGAFLPVVVLVDGREGCSGP